MSFKSRSTEFKRRNKNKLIAQNNDTSPMTPKKGTPGKKRGKGAEEKDIERMLSQSRAVSDCR